MNKRLIFFFTPCIICSVGWLVMLIDGFVLMARTRGWSFNGVIVAAPFLAFYLLSDYLLRRWLPGKWVPIWVIEILLILLSAFLFWSYFPVKHLGPIS